MQKHAVYALETAHRYTILCAMRAAQVVTAPGFILGNVHVFAGVPSILQAMFEGLRDQLPGGVAMTRLTVQCAIGEGTIAAIMESVQATHDGVSIGSYPWFKPGQFGTAAVVSGLDPQVTMAAAESLAAGVRDLGAAADIMPLGQDGRA